MDVDGDHSEQMDINDSSDDDSSCSSVSSSGSDNDPVESLRAQMERHVCKNELCR